jgi:hypothetical protein
LNGSTVGNSLVGVNATVGFLAIEEFLNKLLNLGDTSRSTNQNNFVDIRLLELRIIENGLNGDKGLFEEIIAKLFETGTSDSLLKVEAINEAFNGNLDGHNAGKIAFCLLNLRAKLLEGAQIFLDINIVLLLENLAEVVSKALIKIFATQVSVTGGGKHLEHTVVNSEEGDIKSATTQVENNDVLLANLLVKAISDGSGRGLVDNTENIESRNQTSVLGGLALSVVKVSGHGNDGVLNFLTEVVLSNVLHLDKDH